VALNKQTDMSRVHLPFISTTLELGVKQTNGLSGKSVTLDVLMCVPLDPEPLKHKFLTINILKKVIY